MNRTYIQMLYHLDWPRPKELDSDLRKCCEFLDNHPSLVELIVQERVRMVKHTHTNKLLYYQWAVYEILFVKMAMGIQDEVIESFKE